MTAHCILRCGEQRRGTRCPILFGGSVEDVINQSFQAGWVWETVFGHPKVTCPNCATATEMTA